MAIPTWFRWLDNMARIVRGKQGRTRRRKPRRSAYRLLRLERLEDRLAPASDITILASGVGSLDSVLQANNGVITVNDGANGGTQAETISVAALHSLAATDNINIAARNSITFDDLTPAGDTLALLTSTGHTAAFSAGSGAIQFANLNNNLTTAGGDIQFNAGTNLTLGNLTSDGGAINLTTGVGGTFTASAAGGTLASAGGNITISADNIVIQTGIDTAGGVLTLQQATGGAGSTTRNIDIGGGTTAGDLDLTDAELGFINAGVLRIGRLDNAGNLTVTGNAAGTGGITTHASFSTLDLRSGGSISEGNGNASIAVTNLALQAVGNAGTASNQINGQVSTLAGNVTGNGNSFYFFNQANLSIGSVDGINGITTNDGPIQAFANGATLTVAAGINSQGGTVGLGGEAFVNSAAIATGGGQFAAVGDNMDLQTGSSINAGTGRASLLENAAGTLINLGGADSASPLTIGLTAAELNTITAGTLQIGDSRAGSITLSAAIALAHVATLDLQTGNAISEGANGSLTVANLALQAVNSIGDNGPAIQLIGPTNVAFHNTTAGNVALNCTGALTVTAVDALNGTTGNTVGDFGEGVLLTVNGGPLTFAISTSGFSLICSTTASSPGQNNITVNSGVTLTALGNGHVSLLSVDNILLQSGSTVTAAAGDVFLGAGAGGIDTTATLTNDGTVNGVNVNFNAPGDIGAGTVTATTTAMIASANGAILDNNDTPTAAVLNITATNLSLSASTGIGVASAAANINATQAPLETQVSNVQAETATGGIFIDNGFTTPTALTVGFSGQPLAGVGVQVTGASGDIQLIDNGSIDITNQGDTVSGPGNVTVEANGPTADVIAGANANANSFSVVGTGSGLVTVAAGEDITLGTANFATVASQSGSVVFNAGRNLIVTTTGVGGILAGTGTVTATAGEAITLQEGLATQGGAINLTTGAGGTVTVNPSIEAVQSNGGAITISADNIALFNNAINANTGIVTLQQATGGAGSTTRDIDIGGNPMEGFLNLTDAELGQITAGVLRIGRLDNAGNITVTGGGITAHAGYNTLDLRSGGAISAVNFNAVITVTNLALQSVGDAGQEPNSPLFGNVTTLAGNVTGSGNSFAFVYKTSLSIGSVDGVNGITTNDGLVEVDALILTLVAPVTLTVTDTPAANDINSQGGNIVLSAEFFVNSGTTTAGAAINSGGGAINVTADNMDLQAGSSMNAGTGRVTLVTVSDGGNINLGGADSTTPLTLGLTAAEINTITAGTLQIGDNNANSITITAAIAPAHVTTLVLHVKSDGTGIFEGANGSLAVANLALIAAGGIGDGGAIQLIGPTNVAFTNTATGNVMISDSGALTIAAVDSLNNTNSNNVGNFASGGAITLTANGGPLAFAISTNSDSSTSATTTGTPAGQNNIIVNSGVTVAAVKTNNVEFFSADNIVLQTGSIVQSKTGNVLLSIGSNDSDTVSATLQGTVNGTAPVVQAGSGNASLLVDFANGANLPNGLTFTGGTGNNTLLVSDDNDNTAHTYTLTGSNIVRDGTTINYTNVAGVTVTGGSQADTFNVAPSATTTFTVNGGNPTPPSLPGDTLNVNLAGLATPQLTQTFNPASGFAGQWTFGNAEPISFTNIETLIPAPQVNAQADLAVTASGPAGNLFDSTLTYTYTLTNNGPANAANVTLTVALPAGAKVVSALQLSGGDAFAGAVSGNTVAFTAPLVAAGDTETFQVVVSVAGGAGGASGLGSTAMATSGSPDPNSGNNSATTPANLLSAIGNQQQVIQQAAGQIHTLAGEITTVQQFLFWFGNANAVSGGAVNLLLDELFLALAEMATADGLPFQGFVHSQQQAIAANPLYGTVAGYELGLWSDALASVLF